MSLSESWRRFEDWHIRRCRRGRGAVELVGAALLLPAGAVLLWLGSSTLGDCGGSVSRVWVGALVLAAGWSSLGRAFWSRLVARTFRRE